MTFILPDLPFARNALSPVISVETLEYHHDKHHAAYVANLNKLVEGTKYTGMTLEAIIQNAPAGGVFNNAAQTWNHTFYFNGLCPDGGGKPDGGLAVAINAAFGSFDDFRHQMIASATANFGSGWTWLVKNKMSELEIINTSNANNPLTEGKTPLLAIDVWEHAYYIDYRNARPKYLDAIWQIVNWKFVTGNFTV